MYLSIGKYRISTSLIAIGLTVISVILTILFIIIFKVEDKTISIVNFYKVPITFTLKGSDYLIQPFDSKKIVINTSSNFDINLIDENKKDLGTINVEGINRTAQLIEISLNDNSGYCFFKSGVTSDKDGNPNLRNKIILESKPKKYTVISLDPLFHDYIFPGENIDVSEKYSKPVDYIYPINCDMVDNNKNILQTITAFSQYVPSEQLKYYDEVSQKLEKSKDVKTLDANLPDKTSKYYVSQEKYIFVYE